MTTLFEKAQWNSSPTAYWTIKYEHQRSGVNMQYRFYWKVWLNTSTSWYYDGLQLRLFINGVQNNITVKGYDSDEYGWSYEGTTGWYTVSNKTSGTVPFYAQLYDTNAKIIENTSSSYSLTVAPAASVLSNISSFDVDNEITIGITKYNASFTDTLVISYGSTAIKTVAGISNGAKVKFTSAELTTIYGLMSTVKSGTFTFVLTTKNGSTTIGTSTKTASGSISNANPTFTVDQLFYSDSDSSIVNVTNNPTDIIAGKSSLQIAYAAATGNKGATISKYEFTLNGVTKTKTGADTDRTVNFGKILTAKDLILTVKVTDSRENSTTIEKTIPFIMYSDPVIAPHSNYGEIICKRCDDEGALNAKGTRLRLATKGKWNTLPSGKNGARLQIQCVSSAYNSGWLDIAAEKQGGDEANNYIAWYDVDTVVEGITLDIRTIYTVTIRICDDLTQESKAPNIPTKIPTANATFHLSKRGKRAAFGMYAQRDNAVQIAEDWTLDVLGNAEVAKDISVSGAANVKGNMAVGGLTIDGASIDSKIKGAFGDFVVEQGTSGNWTYRKWNSGIAELWGILNHTSASTDYSEFRVAYPFAFISTPVVVVSADGQGGYAKTIAPYNNTSSKTEAAITYKNSLGSSLYSQFNVHVIGKWK